MHEGDIEVGVTYVGRPGQKARAVFRIRDHGSQGRMVDYSEDGAACGMCTSAREFARWATGRAKRQLPVNRCPD